MDQFAFFAVILLSAIFVGGLIIFLWWWFKRRLISSLSLKLLQIKVPEPEAKDEREALKDINLAEQLFASLAALKSPFVLEAAVHETGQAINFYVAVPRRSVDFAKRQIQGLFLKAQVVEAGDYTIFQPGGDALAGYLKYSESYHYPVRTYRDSEVDTFAPIASVFSSLNEVGDGMTLQIVARPAEEAYKKNIFSAIERLKEGEKLSAITKTSAIKDILGVFSGSTKADEHPERPKIVDDEAVKVLQAKIGKPLFAVNVRVVAAAETRARSEELLLSLAGAFTQFAAPLRNSFKVIRPRNIKKLIYQYVFRDFDPGQTMLMNAEELASIFHLPTTTTGVPHVTWLNTKEAAPPENLPSEGVILGESRFRDESKLVRLTDDDRRRHLYMVGQTGTGKSYLMLSMVAQDMTAGKGLCVIDPHGDLVDKILTLVPPERADDVIVLDPSDLRRPLGMNMLEFNPERPEEKTFIVNELQSIFNRLFDKETMGPMFERYMRNALLLLMEDSVVEPATLMEIPRVFTDAEYRNRKLARINNPTVYDFWTQEAVKATGEAGLQNMAPYITSKFDNFISNDYLRPIIGQVKSAFNFRQAMDENKILLVNLAKGKIGDINAGLLGMIITGRLLMAALSRTDISEAERRDFYLYIDEFQNFTTDSIAVILSEARKYRLDLIITHQFIAQLTDQIREAVFGNVGSLVSFRVGAKDAEALVKQFAPSFAESDLITIENQHAITRLLVNGEPTKPFNFHTLDVAKGSVDLRDKLKELSRLTYGRDAAQINQEIFSRLRS
jgi:hypothetical protein